MEQAVRPKKTKAKNKTQNLKKNVNERTTTIVQSQENSVKDEINQPPVANPDEMLENCDLNGVDENQSIVENEASEDHTAGELLDATSNLNLEAGICSPVVPDHFYKLCTTKKDQEQSNHISTEGGTVLAYTVQESLHESLEVLNDREATSSPTAPELDYTQEISSIGEFILDDTLDDMIRVDPAFDDGQLDSTDMLLPINDDDWELGTGEHHQDQIYPSLQTDMDDSNPSAMQPFTQEQLSVFYHNILLEHADAYTDQFLSDCKQHDDRFKTLLLNYYQARIKLIRTREQYEEHKNGFDNAVENVFVTGDGEVFAEAYCQDQRKVSHLHRYEICKYDAEASARLNAVIREGRRIAGEDVTQACYLSTVARLHCEQCLFEITEKYKNHRNRLKENALAGSLSVPQSSIVLQLVDESVAELKHVANVLFAFARRKRTRDEAKDRFWGDVETWISMIILNLLQSSDCVTSTGRHFSEEMFVINHILRCPPGVHKWADGLVQVSGPGNSFDRLVDKTSLDHSIYLLYLSLRPPKGRTDFLSEFQSQESNVNAGDKPSLGWTLVDDDGEEVDSSTEAGLLPLENDLIVIFRQIPLETILAHTLGVTKSSGDIYHYNDTMATSEDIMNTLAMCDLMCDILGEGLATLGRPKYKQLVRRIAQSMRNTVLVVSHHWMRYKYTIEPLSTSQAYGVQRLQLEFDEFCKRCVSRLLSVARLGIYQFIADLSYHTVSSRAAEALYLLMNVPAGVRSEVDTLVGTDYTRQEWLDFIQDPDTRVAFEEQLSAMPANEIVYLLTTFANLAQARPTAERHLVNVIVIDIFKVSFVYKSTREICSKTGRELLCSVACYHPYTISTLLQYVSDNMATLQSLVVRALRDLPYFTWQPIENDISLVRNWLLSAAVGSTEFLLAQIILQNLNYGFVKGKLFLPHHLLRQIAILLVETGTKLEQDRASLMMKSIDQVSKVASAVRLTGHSIEQQFLSWSWKVLLKLKLHHKLQVSSSKNNLSNGATEELLQTIVGRLSDVPDLNTHSMLLPILQAVKAKQAMGCYVALVMTNLGHSKEAFLHDGLDCLQQLAVEGHVKAVLTCVDCILPLFYDTNINIAQNHRFTDALHHFLHATDEGLMSAFAKSLLADNTVQPNHSSVTLLTSVINNHISASTEDNGATTILSYWLRMVLIIPGWYKDSHLRTLVDFIFKSTYVVDEKRALECNTIFYDSYVDLMLHGNHSNQGAPPRNVVTSFIHMVTGNSNHGPPSFISTIASKENIYLKYATLVAETRYEDDCKLWVTILSTLNSDPKLSVESAVKKCAGKLKLAHTPLNTHLALYRWGELALHTPHDHPLLPIIWYNFFLRFIYLPAHGGNSFGSRFFDPVSMLPLYNKLRSRLQSSMEFHHGIISSQSPDRQAPSKHQILVKLYQAFKLWLEEPKMHEINLYLPSLPSQYNPGLLACVRTRNLNACQGAVDKESVTKELSLLSEIWTSLQKPRTADQRQYKRHSYHQYKDANDSEERISQLLCQFDPPLPIPPRIMYGTWNPPADVGDHSSLLDYNSVLRETDGDIKVLTSFASDFGQMQAKHHEINREFLKILPYLYFMKNIVLSVDVECQSTFSPTHKCAGAAHIDLKFKQKTKNDSAQQKLDANRNAYKNVMEQFMHEDLTEDLCYASLHIESVIRALEINLKNPTYGNDIKRAIYDAGTRLFYQLTDLYCGERTSCFPAKQFISTSVELLGQIFVSQSHDQAVHILNQVLRNPASASLLSPHFAPGSESGAAHDVCVKEYVKMYHQVVRVVSTSQKDTSDVLFVLLTKFDMDSWLTALHPTTNARCQLLQHVFVGLVGCIIKSRSYDDRSNSASSSDSNSFLSNAITHKPSHSAVYEIYVNHLRSLLSYRFPDLFVETLNCMLEASRTQDIKAETWNSVIALSFTENIKFNSSKDGSEQYLTQYSSAIDWNTLLKALELLTTYFSNFRETDADAKSHGLYMTWLSYVPSISNLFFCLCNTFLAFIRRNQLPLLYTETSLTADSQWTPLEPVYDLFFAWIQPRFDLDSRSLYWPWQDCDGDIARFMTDSFAAILNTFCQSEEHAVATYLTFIWSKYAKIVLLNVNKVPDYMYDAYHSTLYGLPWKQFIPDLVALDQMKQICDEPVVKDNPLQFLRFLIPEISWLSMIEMCHVTAQLHSDGERPTEEEWNPVTGEILCRLLHLLFVLGSNSEKLKECEGLESLLSQVELFPWHCITAEQLEYLANLVADRYTWTSVLLYENIKSLKRDPRCVAVRLLKVTCMLPLVGEERANIKDLPSPVLSLSAVRSSSMDWLKRQSYIRCVGRLIQKMKSIDKNQIAIITNSLSRHVERTLESVEVTSSLENASLHLPSLLSVLFDYLNTVPDSCQICVLNSLQSVISRKPLCKSCSSPSEQPLQHCQDCAYSRSRALAPTTLLACITASCNKLSYAGHASVLIEASVRSYLDVMSANLRENACSLSDTITSWWDNLSKAFNKPIADPQELTKQCVQNGCMLTLHIHSLSQVHLPDFHGNMSFLKMELPSDEFREKLYEVVLSNIQWLSDITPTADNESKLILMWDHILNVCSVLLKAATMSPQQGFTTHTVSDIVASLPPILDQVCLDKVKTGLLGSIGIGRQSPLSTEIRLAARCLSLFIKQWLARINPNSSDVISNAQKAYEALMNLSASHKSYLNLQSTVESVSKMLSEENLNLYEHRRFMSIFVKRHFSDKSYLKHITLMT